MAWSGSIFRNGMISRRTPTLERIQLVEGGINHRPYNSLAYESPSDLLEHARARVN